MFIARLNKALYWYHTLFNCCMYINSFNLHYGSKQEKEYVKAVYFHPAYLTYMQSTSCEMLG